MLVILLFSLFSFIKCDLIDTVVAKDKISSFRPFQSNYARSNSPVSSPTSPRIKLESYKALAGETIRLECPQPNPTWFYRRLNQDQTLNKQPADNSKIDGTEDLIVTRHGIINADYKYKIMCHMSLKHKVIIINNIEFEDEGLYTCLYTLPTDILASSFYGKNNDMENNFNGNLIQYRHVFNVTVYTLISGLTINIKPISMKLSPLLITNDFSNNKFDQAQTNNNQFELIESTLTIKENEEFLYNCIVDSSKPAADIRFSVLNNNNNKIIEKSNDESDQFVPTSMFNQASLTSLVSSNTNLIRNSDKTFKTIYSARLKANLNDHGKTIACNAENGFSNQKWENKKTLNILFAPICYHKPNFVYYIGINQTLNVECKILNANPARLNYKWDLNNINGNINFQKENLIKESFTTNILPNPEQMINQNPAYYSNNEYNKVYTTLESDSFINRFKWKPNSMNDYGEIKCIASNEIGSTECVYELKLGGVPNPPTECNFILKNTSAIISCQVGFHQGDPDIYCYLLRKSDNGVYKEHTRNRESCSFIVNDINVNKFNEFWIYSSNKYGHNKDIGVHLTIGELVKIPEPTSNKTIVLIAIGIGFGIFLILGCCFCLKIRKEFQEDNDSVYDTDAYHAKGLHSIDSKKGNNVKLIKGIKVSNDSSYDINDHIKDVKLLKQNELKKPYVNGTLNGAYDKKRDYYTEYTKNYQQQQQQIARQLDERKNKFKSTSTLPTKSMIGKYEVKDLSVSNLKTHAAHSYNQFEKLNNGLVINNDKSLSNTMINEKNSLKMKKSISFTKSTQQSILNIDDSNLIKETTPLFKDNKTTTSSLLTAVTSNTKLISRSSKLSSNSVNSLNDTNILPSNKMVTFGNSNTNNSMRKYPNQSITTLTTAIVSTSTTTARSNSESNDISNDTTTTSPTCSSANNDSESLENSPVIINNILNNSDLTSTSQSFTLNSDSSIADRTPRLSTFSSNKKLNENTIINGNHRKSPQRFLDKLPPLPTNTMSQSPKNQSRNKSEEYLEGKFLNKLCEEIEVSLNVDCVTDDYSSNDFSGDYSFDNDLVCRTPNLVNSSNKTQIYSNGIGTNKYNHLTDLRKNFELNIKQLRNHPNGNYVTTKHKSTNLNLKSNFDNNECNNNNHQSHQSNKTNLGVLV